MYLIRCETYMFDGQCEWCPGDTFKAVSVERQLVGGSHYLIVVDEDGQSYCLPSRNFSKISILDEASTHPNEYWAL